MKQLKELKNITDRFQEQNIKMPLLFVGHGSPMNAIEDNEFSRKWREIGQALPRPNAILCISAHWETHGTYVTAMEKPRTIHDFGGFPPSLFAVQYPASGSPELATATQKIIKSIEVEQDLKWGLDHGAWSILKHLYPAADVPVFQLSLDYTKAPQWHFELGRELAELRRKGVLIIGSGNMVHNLRTIDWRMHDTGHDWALEANETFKKYLEAGDHPQLINYQAMGKAAQLSVPSPDHYLPLLYILGLKEENEKVSFFNDKTLLGSISMTSVMVRQE